MKCEICSGHDTEVIEHGREVNSTTSRIRMWTPDTVKCHDCGTEMSVHQDGEISVLSTDLDAIQGLFEFLRMDEEH